MTLLQTLRAANRFYAGVLTSMIAPQRLFVRGAPSRAHFGASPKCFSCSTEESCWRGANDSTRGRVRSPESEVEEFIEQIQDCVPTQA